ncbi:YcjX family GTP-binding protein [Cochlodiniinecator piscidefendens]|uniref:YcjX family protein n=1 Tax=Cochlodiniinecator piscidefendens TaxID=2715756 RepID=UPI001409D31C|nr:YcjX family protein [Cochlodiniinecator piscidefendens]
MGLSRIVEDITRSVETAADGVTSAFSDTVVRIGVTGLARAGKTVFITSLIANLLDRGRMPQLLAASNGSIRAAYLQPQPDDTVPRFEYEKHLAAMTGPAPHWPESTRAVSQLRLSLRVQPQGFLSGLSGPRTIHLDIIDYPGEWLLDVGMMDMSYEQWSDHVLSVIQSRSSAQAYLAEAADLYTNERYDEPDAQNLAKRYTRYLHAARSVGFADGTPGRFILPGELDGSPVLTFAPLMRPDRPGRRSLWREMERRFDAYKARVVKPFFRDHFARIDRQVVLMDTLGAIHDGPEAFYNTQRSMEQILSAFRPGRNAFLTRLLRGRRVERILFAATKADHLHHDQHPQLTAIMEAMLRGAKDRANFAGAATAAMSIASLRATVEEFRDHDGAKLGCVRGQILEGKQASFYPGALPTDPAALTAPAKNGARDWLNGEYQFMKFAPAQVNLLPGEGPPHIRLDKAAQFLLGDVL